MKECIHKWTIEEYPQLYFKTYRVCVKCGVDERICPDCNGLISDDGYTIDKEKSCHSCNVK